jgi:outer membrane protein assembly factor BamB
VLVVGLTQGGRSPQAASNSAQRLSAAARVRRRANEPVRIRGPLPGALLIADRGNDRMILVDPRHRILWRFPDAHDLARGVRLFFDDDTFVEPGGKAIVSNEEDNQTVVSVSIKTHRIRHLAGIPGVKGGGPHELDWPDDAYVLPDGTLTVADAYNCRILFIRNHRIVRQIGTTGVCAHDPPRTLGAVNGDTPVKGGGVLVSEISGSWIDEFSRTGRLLWSTRAPVGYPSDPQPLPGGRVLLADYSSPGAAVIINHQGAVLWQYRPTSGWGELNHPSLAFMLPNGDIAINDDYDDRIVIVDPHTNRIVWQYGHAGLPGSSRDQLNTPDGMDFIPLARGEKPLWRLVHHP